MKRYVLVLAILLSFVSVASAQTVRKEILFKELDVPWGMEFMPDGQLLVSFRNGEIKIFNVKTKAVRNVKGVPSVYVEGQGGLLDIALHPHFTKNRLVYFTYAAPEEDDRATTYLARAILENDSLNDLKVLFKASPAERRGIHFGSRIAFDGKGHIFFTVGERNDRTYAQKTDNHLGKVLRLKDDGGIPQDNPFVGKKGSKPEIWSYGHRNPQGLWYDQATGNLWEMEHGPRGGDEINLIKKGANYGWPVATYGKEYYGPKIADGTKEGTEQPVKYYVPSIAPCDLLLYSGKKYPEWKGSLFSGALVLTHLNRVELNGVRAGKEERFFEKENRRVRSLAEDAAGDLYLGTDNGEIWKVIK